MYTRQRLLALLIGAALMCSCGAQAPSDPGSSKPAPGASATAAPPGEPVATAPAQVDPPARVARLSNMSGNVNFTPAGENDWVQAQLNRPVVTGDRLWTADGSRAELQVGSSTIRLDNGSNFDFLNLNDQIAQMELTSGSLNLDVYRLNANETYEVDTPTIAFVANRVGDYRVDVDPTGGFTTVTARRGGGDVVGQGGKRVTIEEGQSLRFHDSSLNDYQTNRVAAQDDFDYYCSRRAERHERAASRNYVSDRVVGYEDLDEYGTWEEAPAYGHVWYPTRVSVGWAPYHHGHWAWIDPWGWTWVDDAPWGYAPFHYGRWAYIDTRWGWVPGPVAVEPVYAPALVAFVGGGGFGLSVSVGGPVGWFALGPGDVYFPGYGASSNYFSRVNVSNTYVNQTVVNNYYGAWSNGNVNYSQMTFANRNAPSALTAMPATAFAAGSPVATSAVAVNRATMANARVLPRATVAPTPASLTAGSARGTAPPAGAANRTVVAANTPPPAPASFAQRQPLLQKNNGQPLSTNQLQKLAAQPNARGNATANNVRVVGNRGGATAQAANATTTTPGNGNARGGQQSQTTSGGRNSAERTATNAGTPLPHVPSADFAHPGAAGRDNAPGGGAMTQSARGQAKNAQPTASNNRGPQYTLREGARGNAAGATESGRSRSSTAARQPSGQGANALNRPGETQQQRRAAAATSPGAKDRIAHGNSNAPTLGQRAESSTRGQSRAPATKSRPAYTLREPQQQRAPAQRNAPQRGPMQAPQHAVAQHAPPPPQQMRGPGPQRQTSVARQAPQPRAPHGGNDKKKDNGGGG